MNRYIVNVGLNEVKIFHHQEDYLFGKKYNKGQTFFYIFTTENTFPNKLSRQGFIGCFSNFQVLRSDTFNRNITIHINKQKFIALESLNIVSPKKKKDVQTKINIGNYFTSITRKKLFGCKYDEEVYDCMSRRIDMFDDILANNLPISKIINKCSKESELTPSQVITINRKISFIATSLPYYSQFRLIGKDTFQAML